MEQIQMCASILLSVKWNIGCISKVPFEIRKTRSTTHSPWYWFITRSVSRSVLMIYPFNPYHLQSSAIFSSLILTSISLLISRNLLSQFHLRIVELVHVAIDVIEINVLIIVRLQVVNRCQLTLRLRHSGYHKMA